MLIEVPNDMVKALDALLVEYSEKQGKRGVQLWQLLGIEEKIESLKTNIAQAIVESYRKTVKKEDKNV